MDEWVPMPNEEQIAKWRERLKDVPPIPEANLRTLDAICDDMAARRRAEREPQDTPEEWPDATRWKP